MLKIAPDIYFSHSKRRASQRGTVLVITLTMALIVSVLAMSMFALSTTSTRIASRGLQKIQATALAEAGVHAEYAQLENALYASSYSPSANSLTGTLGTNGSFNASLLNTVYPALPSPSDTSTYSVSGTMQTKIETIVANNNSSTPPSTTTTVKTTVTDLSTATQVSSTTKSTTTSSYIFTVTATGAATNGTQSSSQATFESTLTTQSGYNYFTLPEGALVSNGNIKLQGSSQTKDPSVAVLRGAGALANGIVTNVGSSYYVDGSIGVAPSSYNATLAALSPIQDATGSLTNLAGPIPFPSASLINNITSTWLAAAQSSSVTYNASGIPGTISGSCVINGDLDLSHGANITLDPGSNPQPVVVYVNGNINYSNGNGKLTNKGVILVCTGTFYLGNNGTYSTTNLQNSLLASLSTSSTAITLSGNGTMQLGICQALNGGVLLQGNGTLTGSIQAGKSGANGGIALQGNPTVIYPPGLNSNSLGDTNNPPPPHYLSGPLSQWVQTL